MNASSMRERREEITWSLFHPVAINAVYMAEIIEKAGNYNVDSFEICGQCHHPLGGLDGLMLYEKYPQVNSRLNTAEIEENRLALREILKLAHASGRPVLYWHREVMVPPEIINAVPGMLDENGEFDLLGDDFESLLRYKLDSAFSAVPELDGLVLTLTEADYSVIHNSNPGKYPPVKVVEKIVRVFASELAGRGKRFVLRSFGSIAQDYEDILDGAELAAKEFSFEVETKITPYDFVPFLPINPFFRKINGIGNSAECDSIGEFLGAGYLPAANVENIVRYVNEAVEKNVSRYAIRIDRIGNSIFRTHEINLFAYKRAIEEAGIPAEKIWNEWAALRWKNCRTEMIELSKSGFELVRKAHYIDGNVIFHMYPPDGSMKWLKAGGIFALFKNGVSLKTQSGIWSILSQNNTPGRENIRKEKAEAVQIAEDGVKKINGLRGRLSKEEFEMLEPLWQNGVVAAKAVKAFSDCVCAYFDDMEQLAADARSLKIAVAEAKKVYAGLRSEKSTSEFIKRKSSDAIEHHAFAVVRSVDMVYAVPLDALCEELLNEYDAEFAASEELRRNGNMLDFIICGGITHEWRVGRYMHASHSFLRDGILSRTVGNRIFPNGFIDMSLSGDEKNPFLLVVRGNPTASSAFRITVNGKSSECEYDENGIVRLGIPASGTVQVRIEKTGTSYPEIRTVHTEKTPT